MPNDSPERRRRIVAQRAGPLLVEGPVEVTLDDGTTVSSDRFCVALCTCRRSRTYPWCDTSHRKSVRPNQTDTPGTEATTELNP
ncbi:CDGSH iron-sulfur domain-containing protein [Streptomyces sp. NPDC007095]|uniref:CDGSH iron-sulfur domain-containing protein n=1 Tax=Streptomyces sp. NPDC007095 TaxID=3154482 RepID=UPI000C70DC5F